jgi:tetratricopeptide (TPR) repeat protein
MTGRRKKRESPERFARIRMVKNALFGVQIASVLAFSGYLVYKAGFRTDPLFVPLDTVLNLLLLTVVLLAVENVIFRALEIKHAPREGQRFLIAQASWRGAKRALTVAVVIALIFTVPVVRATVTGLLSSSSPRTLNMGESYTLSFSNQDFLGITEAKDLRVVVLNGALRVTIREDGVVLNPGGSNLTAGEQQTFAISSSQFLTYTVTFENLANASTTFTYKVTVGFPPGLVNLVTLLSGIIALLNIAWLAYLRPRRGRMQEEMPYPQPVPQPAYVPSPMPTAPVERPWYELHSMWHSVYTPWRSVPPRSNQREERVSTATTEELPPPPPQVEPYEVEVPPPPPDEPQEDADRLLLREVSVDIPALMDKADERVAAGDLQEALQDYDTILQVDGRNLRALLKKAELLERLHRPGEALQCLEEALRIDPWHPQALLSKARLLEEEGRDDEALECYDTILRGGPHYLEALVRKGDMMARMGEPELALEAYEDALRLRPGDEEIAQRIEAVREQCEDPLDAARREMESGDLERAEEQFRRALKGERADEARRELADLYLRTNREEEALQLLDQAIEADPGDLKLVLKRVKALVRRGRLADALEACERACELAPEEATLWAIKGGLEADLGLDGKAVESLERALELNPEDVDSRQKLERIRSSQQEAGQLEEVLRSIEEIPEEAVSSILKVYRSLKELKGAKVKELASLEGVTEELAKRVLKRVRKGR